MIVYFQAVKPKKPKNRTTLIPSPVKLYVDRKHPLHKTVANFPLEIRRQRNVVSVVK